MAVLICGGAGYIGSHVNKCLSRNGRDTVIYDNLVYGHREAVKWGKFVKGDLADTGQLARVFSEYSIDAVVHLAAYAYVGESHQTGGILYQQRLKHPESAEGDENVRVRQDGVFFHLCYVWRARQDAGHRGHAPESCQSLRPDEADGGTDFQRL